MSKLTALRRYLYKIGSGQIDDAEYLSLTCPPKTVPVIKLENNLNWTCKEANHAKKILQT